MRTDPPPIDTRVEIVTPEHVAFQHELAGPARRAIAYAIDLLVLIGLLLVLAVVLGIAGALAGTWGALVATGYVQVAWFAASWFLGGFLETVWNGQTVGKRWAGIRAVSTDGQPISGLQAVMRNLLRLADGMPVLVLLPDIGFGEVYLPLCLVGLVAAAANSRFQRLGDLACGTMVVCEHRHGLASIPRIAEPAVLALAEVIPADFEATRGLARALSGYAGRRGMFSPALRNELARHLAEPLRLRLNLPAATDPDHLLCALYNAVFFAGERGPLGAPQPAARS